MARSDDDDSDNDDDVDVDDSDEEDDDDHSDDIDDDDDVDVDDSDDDDEEEVVNNNTRFSQVCNRLRRNDSTLTFVHLRNRYPYGYGRILGEALTNNTHVTTLGINVCPLLGEDDDDDDDSDYDPKEDKEDENDIEHNVDDEFYNEKDEEQEAEGKEEDDIESRNVYLNSHNETNDDATTNNKNNDNNNNIRTLANGGRMRQLVQYIRTSSSLRTVYILATEPFDETYNIDDYGQEQRNAVTLLTEAASINPNIVEIMFAESVIVTSASLVQLLRDTRSLTSLTMELGVLFTELMGVAFDDDDNNSSGATELYTNLREAFTSNTTLQKLALSITMDSYTDEPKLQVLHHILQSLTTHPKLQELSIEVLDGFTDATVLPILVSQYLAVPHNTRSLRKLELMRFPFKQKEPLSNLLNVGMAANPQLTTLAFTGCVFDGSATHTLIDYFQQRQQQQQQMSGSPTSSCYITHLHFECPSFAFDGGRANRRVFAALAPTTTTTTSMQSRGGQQQHHPTLLNELQMRDGTELFRFLLKSSNDGEHRRCRLPRCIRLTTLTISAWEAIQQYLVHHHVGLLQELVVCGRIEGNIGSHTIVDTIRRNGSLQSITMEHTYMQRLPIHLFDHMSREYMPVEQMDRHAGPFCIFGVMELQRIRAYFQRNKEMSKHLSIDGSSSSSSLHNTTTNYFATTEMMCVVPTYFRVVCEARRMAPTVIFQMLLSMDMSIGAQKNVPSPSTNVCKKPRSE